jgi:mono/diheme cytochrome c family protein
MIARSLGTLSVAILAGVIGVAARQPQPLAFALTAGGQSSSTGWQLPPDVDDTKNPLTVDAKVVATGRSLFMEKCKRCHGPAGLGDGPDADPDAPEEMDLTNPKRAERNSDGIVFYKAWNGRKKPKMPAFKEELTKDQLWAIVSYVQTLRKPAAD